MDEKGLPGTVERTVTVCGGSVYGITTVSVEALVSVEVRVLPGSVVVWKTVDGALVTV